MSGPALTEDYCSGFRVLRQDTAEARAALSELLPDPDAILAGGITCKPGSRAHGALVTLAGRSYFLKRYNCRGWLYRMQNAVRRSRAVYTWQLAWSLLERSVPVPEPLLCLEERTLRLLGRSYVLMDVAQGQGLRELWPAMTENARAELLAELGEMFGRMHRQGCLHGDLKWDNIMLSADGVRPQPTLVDLDGGRRLWWPCRWLARRDLARFLEDLQRFDGDENRKRSLLKAWQAGWENLR